MRFAFCGRFFERKGVLLEGLSSEIVDKRFGELLPFSTTYWNERTIGKGDTFTGHRVDMSHIDKVTLMWGGKMT